VLVVACGNTLRGDDAVGPAVGDLLATRLAGTAASVIVSDQLLPELADDARRAHRVVFVDAAADRSAGSVSVRSVAARRAPDDAAGNAAGIAVGRPAASGTDPAIAGTHPAASRTDPATAATHTAADRAAGVPAPEMRSLQPFSHGMGPEDVLTLARDLYGATPEAVLVSVGAKSFEPGAELSRAVRLAIPGAVAAVLQAIEEETGSVSRSHA
jgi:Ni,Fe-hydrogenase maturation factor